MGWICMVLPIQNYRTEGKLQLACRKLKVLLMLNYCSNYNIKNKNKKTTHLSVQFAEICAKIVAFSLLGKTGTQVILTFSRTPFEDIVISEAHFQRVLDSAQAGGKVSSVLDKTTTRISSESKLPGDSLNVCGQELVLAPAQT